MTDVPPPVPQWASSRSVGGISEIAVLSPIRQGIVPGERRSYEERLRATIANLAARHEQGIPTELDRVSTIHFGRLIILRPEQYLLYSNPAGAAEGVAAAAGVPLPQKSDDYVEIPDGGPAGSSPPANASPHRSWLLTLVEFDGDLKTYMRDIAQFINTDFDYIFRDCEEYPGTANFELFWSWIRLFQINTGLFYSTYRDVSVVRIKQLEQFKRRFDDFVARVRAPEAVRGQALDAMFDEFLRANQQYASGFPAPGGTYPPAGGSRGGQR